MGFWLPSLAPLGRFPRRREQLFSKRRFRGTLEGPDTPVQMLGERRERPG